MVLLSIIISLNVKSQTFKVDSFKNSLPTYYIQNGDTLGIIISIEQAQKIDNDEELLDLFEKMHISCDSTIKKYIAVVNEYDKKIAIMDVKISKMDSISKEQTVQIANLKNQVANFKAQLATANGEIKSLNNIVGYKDTQIGKLRFAKGAGITGTIVGFGLFILYAVTHK